MRRSDHFRAHCRLLRIATLAVFAGLALLFALGVAGPPWLSAAGAAALDPETRRWLSLVFALPACGYLFALWAVQRALADLAAGHLFHDTVAQAMRRIGAGVLIGALLNVVVVINLTRWILDGHGSYLYFDLSGIVLGVVGAALILLARLIDQARALQSELDAIV